MTEGRLGEPSSRSPSLAVRLVGGVMALLIFYLVLVGANLALVEAMKQFAKSAVAPEAKAAADARRKQVDPSLIRAAEAEGFLPTLLPQALDKPWRYPELTDAARAAGLPPLGGHPGADTYFCNEGYGLIRYRSDRFGLRNDDSLWDRLGEVRAVAIGDSFIHGACVEAGDTPTARLSAGGLTTLNLGVAANHPVHYRFAARAFLPAIRPQHALVFFYANDNLADDDLARAEESIYAAMLAADAPLSAYFGGAPGGTLAPSAAYRAAMARYREIAAVRDGKANKSFFAEVSKREYWTLRQTRALLAGLLGGGGGLAGIDRAAIDEVRALCASHGCAPLVVYIPNNPAAAPDPRAHGYRDELAAYTATTGVPFLDASAKVEALGRDAFALSGGHLSPSGYAALAEAVLQKLDGG